MNLKIQSIEGKANITLDGLVWIFTLTNDECFGFNGHIELKITLKHEDPRIQTLKAFYDKKAMFDFSVLETPV